MASNGSFSLEMCRLRVARARWFRTVSEIGYQGPNPMVYQGFSGSKTINSHRIHGAGIYMLTLGVY